MEYSESPRRATELLEAIEEGLAQERADRTDGRPHVSDVIYCLRKSWRKRQVTEAPTKDDEDRRLILIIGQALHSIVAKADKREANVRLESDWLVGEADGRVLDDGTVEEFKTARAGFAEDDPKHFPHYAEQIASYIVLARDMGVPLQDDFAQAVLHVLHLNFNNAPRWYEPHPRQRKKETDDEYAIRLATLRAEKKIEYEEKVTAWLEEKTRHSNLRSWPLRFTQDEIDRWEQELHRRVEILMAPEEPSVDECAPTNGWSGLSWECSYCPYHIRQGGDCMGGPGRPANFFPIDFTETLE